MSVEYVICCDHCGGILDGSYRSAAAARKVVREELDGHTNLRGGRDICAGCWAHGYR